MTPKLHHVTYSRRKATDNFIVQIQPWAKDAKNIVGFDVSEAMNEAISEDNAYDHEPMTGPVFHHEVIRVLEAAKTHIRVSNAWIASVKTQDAAFQGFVDSHLQNARSAPDFFESIRAFRERQNMPERRVDNLNDVDVLDFRPVMGFKGVWKNLRNNHVNINRTWDYGTIFKN